MKEDDKPDDLLPTKDGPDAPRIVDFAEREGPHLPPVEKPGTPPPPARYASHTVPFVDGVPRAKSIFYKPSLYSAEQIASFVHDHVYALGDTAKNNHKWIDGVFSKTVRGMTPWDQVLLMGMPGRYYYGTPESIAHHTNSSIRNYYGIYYPGTNNCYTSVTHNGSWRLENGFAHTFIHEYGHKTDYAFTRNSHGWDNKLSDMRAWKIACDRETDKVYSEGITSIDNSYPGLSKFIRNYPGISSRNWYLECYAEFTGIVNRTYAHFDGDWDKTKSFLTREYPALGPVYCEQIVPKLINYARQINPAIDTVLPSEYQHRGTATAPTPRVTATPDTPRVTTSPRPSTRVIPGGRTRDNVRDYRSYGADVQIYSDGRIVVGGVQVFEPAPDSTISPKAIKRQRETAATKSDSPSL